MGMLECHYLHHKDHIGSNPAFRDEKPVTNRHNTLLRFIQQYFFLTRNYEPSHADCTYCIVL